MRKVNEITYDLIKEKYGYAIKTINIGEYAYVYNGVNFVGKFRIR